MIAFHCTLYLLFLATDGHNHLLIAGVGARFIHDGGFNDHNSVWILLIEST